MIWRGEGLRSSDMLTMLKRREAAARITYDTVMRQSLQPAQRLYMLYGLVSDP